MSEDLSRTPVSLREQLREVAARVHPFPTFLGRNWLEAVEVEGGPVDVDRGCVVVCPDGELYELALRLIPGAEVVSDPNPTEELVSPSGARLGVCGLGRGCLGDSAVLH